LILLDVGQYSHPGGQKPPVPEGRFTTIIVAILYGAMFQLKHDAYECIAKGKQLGIFKNCAHLEVRGGFDGMQSNPYQLYCTEHFLLRIDQGEFQNRCPENCYSFQDKNALERKKRWAKRWEWIIAKGRVPFRYFERLKATTQALILILLIVWLLPRLGDTVLKIIMAVKDAK
jgi:hypothetical protein